MLLWAEFCSIEASLQPAQTNKVFSTLRAIFINMQSVQKPKALYIICALLLPSLKYLMLLEQGAPHSFGTRSCKKKKKKQPVLPASQGNFLKQGSCAPGSCMPLHGQDTVSNNFQQYPQMQFNSRILPCEELPQHPRFEVFSGPILLWPSFHMRILSPVSALGLDKPGVKPLRGGIGAELIWTQGP